MQELRDQSGERGVVASAWTLPGHQEGGWITKWNKGGHVVYARPPENKPSPKMNDKSKTD